MEESDYSFEEKSEFYDWKWWNWWWRWKNILVTLFLDKETDDWKKEIRVKLIWIHPHQI